MKKTTIYALLCGLFFVSSTYAKDKPIVTMAKAKKTVFEKTMLFPAKIYSKVSSLIKSDGDLIVIDKLVKLGQEVKKGDPLLVLRNRDLSMHYEKRILKATVDGVVANINVNKGQYISRGEELIHINDPSALAGRIEVSAADYKKIKSGLTGTIDISSLELKDLPITITGVGTAVDNLTGTVSVDIDINKDLDKLIPGVIGLAKVSLNKEERLLVKEKALYYIGEDVFIATADKNKKVKKIKVKLGKRFKEKIEVLDGLKLDSEYIVESPKFLRDTEEVAIKESDKKKKESK